MHCQNCGSELRITSEQVGIGTNNIPIFHTFAYCDLCGTRQDLTVNPQGTNSNSTGYAQNSQYTGYNTSGFQNNQYTNQNNQYASQSYQNVYSAGNGNANINSQGKRKDTGLSIAAAILALFTFTFWIGAILAIVDLVKNKNDGRRHLGSYFALIFSALIILVLIAGNLSKESTDSERNTSETSTVELADNIPQQEERNDEDEIDEDDIEEKDPVVDLLSGLGMEEKNAVREAESYLEFMAFSRQGLVDQLSSPYGSGYTADAAAFAVAFLEENGLVDWNEQAVREAQSYLETMAFSRNELKDQLSSEYGAQFTTDEAEYAVSYLEENGLVDWKEQAVEAAKSYLEFMSFSRQGLIDQLTSEYGSQFTLEEAEYAADQLGY